MRGTLCSFSLSCLLATASAAHADTVYTSAAAYNAATTTTATATFNGIAPSGSFVDETPSFTTAGATFTSGGSSHLFVIDPAYYGSAYSGGGFVSSDYNSPTDQLTVSLPSSSSISFNYGGLLGPTAPFTILLSDGFSYTFLTTDSILGPDASLAFIGFTASTPITGFTLTLPDSPAYNAIDNVSYGGALPSAVPEPSSLLLLGTGTLSLVGAVRRKILPSRTV